MPVYGKRNSPRKPVYPKHTATIFRPELESKTRPRTTRIFSGRQWSLVSSSLARISQTFGFDLVKAIRVRVQKSEKPVIVDYGCGKGTAITELAQAFPNARCFGFSEEFYDEWKENRNVEFVHESSFDFPRLFGKKKIDYAYSHYGLSKSSNIPFDVKRLLPKMKIGGKIVFNSSDLELLHDLRKIPGIQVKIVNYSKKRVIKEFHIPDSFCYVITRIE
ncbi:MAG: class I SAM-dependent methyltransferase [Candidatus Diapherotrites archaeon]|nr:class I SAM-dependent methyltransferase [Candidatus Diapherotrites archaeon]